MAPNWQTLITHMFPLLGSCSLIEDNLFKKTNLRGKSMKGDSSRLQSEGARGIIFTLVASYSRLTREWWQSLGANHILLKPKLPPRYTPLLSISGSLFLFFLLKMRSPIFAFPSECGRFPRSFIALLSQGSHLIFVQKICLGMSLSLES